MRISPVVGCVVMMLTALLGLIYFCMCSQAEPQMEETEGFPFIIDLCPFYDMHL